jgi:D-glucosaminate-6-phosphate ammonia-lyase
MGKRTRKITRRGLLQAGAGMAVGGMLPENAQAQQRPRPSVYEALGVKHVINATGTVTNLGGSVMPLEVVAAWTDASRHFVNLLELHDKVGERIARLIGVEAALVTTGAAGALLLATAGIVTRGEAARIRRLPDTTDVKNEVILQRAHHTCYDNQLADVGIRLIEVETAAQARRAINDRTALMFFMNFAEPDGRISRQDWIDLARSHRIPTLLDAAADVPPLERLAGYNRMGFDLVAISGGKAIRGPNDTGLLLGRRTLIEAAKRNTNPHCGTIGRMMKVGKEDMIALLAAVERFVNLDHDAEWREYERRMGIIEAALRDVPTLQTERIVPGIANHVPHLQLSWDEKRLGVTRARLTRALMEGEAPIQIGRVSGTGDRGVLISVLTLQSGEERLVADRLHAILRQADR